MKSRKRDERDSSATRQNDRGGGGRDTLDYANAPLGMTKNVILNGMKWSEESGKIDLYVFYRAMR